METHRAMSKNKDDGMIWIDECDMRRQMRGQDETTCALCTSVHETLQNTHGRQTHQQRNKDDIHITESPSPSGRSVVLSPSLRRRLI
jgi:hypothetical protein